MSKPIAFFRTESWPYANVKMVEVLQRAFPNHEIQVFDFFDWIKSKPFVIARNSVEVCRAYGKEILTGKKRFKQCFWRTGYIFNQMKNHAKNIINNNDYWFSFQMQSLFDGSVFGLPHFVYTDHTHLENLNYPGSNANNLYSRDWIDLEKSIYHNATINFVRSSNIVTSLIKNYQCDPSSVICAYGGSNAIDLGHKIARNKYHKKEILFVGINWERKGGPDLVEAFVKIQTKHPDANLIIIGCEPDIKVQNCKVVGRIPVSQVGDYYKNASIFCMPTNLEPFGVAFIEAMTSKTPIIATDVGAIPDFIDNGKTGLLVKPGDVAGLADAMDTLLSNPDYCRNIADNAYQLAEQRYSWSAVGILIRERIIRHL